MAETLDAFGEIAISVFAAMIDEGDLVGAAGVEIALEDVGGEIVIARDGAGTALGVTRYSSRRFLVGVFWRGGRGFAHRLPTARHYADVKIRPQCAANRRGNGLSSVRNCAMTWPQRPANAPKCLRRSLPHDFEPRPHPHHPCRQPAAQRDFERPSDRAGGRQGLRRQSSWPTKWTKRSAMSSRNRWRPASMSAMTASSAASAFRPMCRSACRASPACRSAAAAASSRNFPNW